MTGAAVDDTAIVGAGPAGLSAALYAARYLRTTRVLHDGRSRAAHIPCTHNVPGFDEGIVGARLLERLARQATKHGAQLTQAHVTRVDVTEGGEGGESGEGGGRLFELASGDGRRWRARTVILATGIEHNHLPMDEASHQRASARGVLRYCPVCDGYEHRGLRIGVVGCSVPGASEALFVQRYSDDVTLLTQHDAQLDTAQREALATAGIPTVTTPIAGYEVTPGGMRVRLAGESGPLEFDVLYPALGSRPRNGLAAALGIAVNDDGQVDARAPYRTAVPGLWCAGDLVDGLDQVSVAMGQGAIAATRAHHWLQKGTHPFSRRPRPIPP